MEVLQLSEQHPVLCLDSSNYRVQFSALQRVAQHLGLIGTSPPARVRGKAENGGRYRIRTYDFHRVNNAEKPLNPLYPLCFPHFRTRQKPQKTAGFVDELLTSFFVDGLPCLT